jgi:nicotinamide-nucleotide amidase
MDLYYHTTVGDNEDRLIKALDIACSRADLVITTGGLGPTRDDITREAVAKYLDKHLVFDSNTMKRIESYFKEQGLMLTDTSDKQALILEEAIVMRNHVGTAPGLIVEGKGKKIILMPGPPKELEYMFKEDVLPYLRGFSEKILFSKTLRVVGMLEIDIEHKISDLIDKAKGITLATYDRDGIVDIRLSCKVCDKARALSIMSDYISEIYVRLGDSLFGEDDKTLACVVIDLLKSRGFTISVAESYTGGMLTSELVSVSGASSVLKEGIVCYSNESKISRLDVSKHTLDTYGAVSYETVNEMLKGLKRMSKTSVGIATTGMAEDAYNDNAHGFIGIYVDEDIIIKKILSNKDRNGVRMQACQTSLDMLRKLLIKIKK